MDYATCCFPVTNVDPKLDQPFAPHDFYNHEDEALFNMCKYLERIRRFLGTLITHGAIDRPELFKDAPVGLQIMGRPQEEEAVIAMTQIVDEALKGYRSSRKL